MKYDYLTPAGIEHRERFGGAVKECASKMTNEEAIRIVDSFDKKKDYVDQYVGGQGTYQLLVEREAAKLVLKKACVLCDVMYKGWEWICCHYCNFSRRGPGKNVRK